MLELERVGPKVVNAILGRKPEYIRIVDWEGKPLVGRNLIGDTVQDNRRQVQRNRRQL
jgi:hypothetical protein